MKYVLYVLLSGLAFSLGSMYGVSTKNPKETHLCATFNQLNVELEVNSAYLLMNPASGEILAPLSAEELPTIMKDERLTFHTCSK